MNQTILGSCCRMDSRVCDGASRCHSAGAGATLSGTGGKDQSGGVAPQVASTSQKHRYGMSRAKTRRCAAGFYSAPNLLPGTMNKSRGPGILLPSAIWASRLTGGSNKF